jgi:hypothetical protein
MTSQTTNPPGDDVSESDIAAVEAVLRHIDAKNKNRHILGQIAQWFLVLGMYKELEVNFSKAKAKNRDIIKSRHRAILTTVMSVGEMLLSESETIEDQDLCLINYSRDALLANVRYLREKYAQWYVPIDVQEINRVWPKLQDERKVDIDTNFRAKV